MSFPFPQLLAFLESEKDQIEFMKIAAEAGLDSGDLEFAKLLVAFQLYAAIYAKTPREIKAVHQEALFEFGRIRDEAESFAVRAASDAAKIGQWADEILRALNEAGPAKLAETVHKRLLDDTLKMLGGSLQAFTTAYTQIETATKRMNSAACSVSTAIESWQALSLRRVWSTAFCSCLIVVSLFLFLRHQQWWLALQQS